MTNKELKKYFEKRPSVDTLYVVGGIVFTEPSVALGYASQFEQACEVHNRGDEDEPETGEQETGEMETGEQETVEMETGEQETEEPETEEMETGEMETGEMETGETESGEQETGETEIVEPVVRKLKAQRGK